jgi:hypothetical protein
MTQISSDAIRLSINETKIKATAMGIRIGIGNRIKIGGGGGQSWESYWASQPEVLFFGLYSEISGGQMPNKVEGSSDYLTVAGAAGSETYQAPNAAPYIAADADYLWFTNNSVQRTVLTSELIGYDYQRTPVKYEDESPNEIVAIIILNAAVTGIKRDNLFRDMWLSVYWDDSHNDNGHVKENRGAEQKLFATYGTAYNAVFNALVIKPSSANITIQQTLINAIVTAGGYAKAEALWNLSADSQANSLFDWKNPTGTHNPTLGNTPAFTQYAGFKGNGSNAYINFHFNPKTDCLIATLNNITVMCGIGDDVSESKQDWGAGSAATHNLLWLQSRNTSNLMVQTVNCSYVGTSVNAVANANSKKHYTSSRLDSANHLFYINKAKTSKALASTDFPDFDLYGLADNNGSAVNNNTKTLRYLFIFSGLTDDEIGDITDAMEAYLDNYGTGLI